MNHTLTLLTAITLGGCAMAPIADIERLTGARWQLQGASDDTFTLELVDGMVVGKGGCNNYKGAITEQGDHMLTIGPIGSTRMLCKGELAQQEAEYLQALQQVATYGIKDQQLILRNADNQIVLSFNGIALKPE